MVVAGLALSSLAGLHQAQCAIWLTVHWTGLDGTLHPYSQNLRPVRVKRGRQNCLHEWVGKRKIKLCLSRNVLCKPMMLGSFHTYLFSAIGALCDCVNFYFSLGLTMHMQTVTPYVNSWSLFHLLWHKQSEKMPIFWSQIKADRCGKQKALMSPYH